MPTTAKTCDSCGAIGQEGAFCDECGETLPETVSPPEPPEPSPAPASSPGPAPSAGSDPGSAATRINYPVSDSPTRLDLPAQPAATEPVESGAEPGHTPVFTPAADPNEQARALIVPVADPLPKPSPVTPVLPGRPEPALPLQVQMQEAETTEGGTPCPWCGTPNPVGRHFCRRCAMSMEKDPEAAPVHRPWWRRMVDWQNRPIPYAGQRPRLRRGPGQLVRLLITLAVVLLLIVLASIFGPAGVEAIEDHFATPRLESVARLTTNDAGLLNPPSNLTDGWSNTWWGTGGTAAGVSLDVTLLSPADLLDVIVTPGAGTTQQEFTSEDSPKTLTLTMTSQSGQKTVQTLKLSSSAGPQTFPVHADNVKTIHIVVGAANPGTGSDPQIAISGLEFFGK